MSSGFEFREDLGSREQVTLSGNSILKRETGCNFSSFEPQILTLKVKLRFKTIWKQPTCHYLGTAVIFYISCDSVVTL